MPARMRWRPLACAGSLARPGSRSPKALPGSLARALVARRSKARSRSSRGSWPEQSWHVHARCLLCTVAAGQGSALASCASSEGLRYKTRLSQEPTRMHRCGQGRLPALRTLRRALGTKPQYAAASLSAPASRPLGPEAAGRPPCGSSPSVDAIDSSSSLSSSFRDWCEDEDTASSRSVEPKGASRRSTGRTRSTCLASWAAAHQQQKHQTTMSCA
mmetsp:Transcript_72273/g.224412  ORF Transcript_72273/g.224412 Transcript_72273/m.224412 type:complete len:216 (-) Transcript_72273:915-1562(-)